MDDEESLKSFITERMSSVSERTLTSMLMEMRKLDRDRDRVLHPSTVEQLLEKYKLPLGPGLGRLLDKFRDSKYRDNTNYEHLVRYLEERREEANNANKKNTKPKEEKEAEWEHLTSKSLRRQVEARKVEKPLGRNKTWSDKEETALLVDLERELTTHSDLDIDLSLIHI